MSNETQTDPSQPSHPFLDLARAVLSHVCDLAEAGKTGNHFDLGVAFIKAESHLSVLIKGLAEAVLAGQQAVPATTPTTPPAEQSA